MVANHALDEAYTERLCHFGEAFTAAAGWARAAMDRCAGREDADGPYLAREGDQQRRTVRSGLDRTTDEKPAAQCT